MKRFLLILGLLVALWSQSNAGIMYGPYLQNVSKNSVTIMWLSDENRSGSVSYGKTDSYGYQENSSPTRLVDENVWVHEVALNSLQSGSTYHYKVQLGSDESSDYTFKTDAGGNSFRFAVFADIQRRNTHVPVAQSIIRSQPDIIVSAGDLPAHGDELEDWENHFFSQAYYLPNIPFFPSLGNHDLYGSGWEYYKEIFSVPDNGDHERYYHFDYGNAKFIIIDSFSDISSGSAQYDWIENVLSSTNKKWIFAVFHKPPFSSGPASKIDYKAQSYLAPLFEKYGVSIVFSGHSHNYERSLLNGVYYIVTGGGGASLKNVQETENPYQIYAQSLHHHCAIQIDDNKLTFEAKDTNDDVFDSFQMNLSAPQSPQLCVSTHSLDFGTSTTEADLVVENCGSGTLTWDITCTSGENWISDIQPKSGSLSAEDEKTISITIDRQGLAAGTYYGTLEVNSNAGSQEISLSMEVYSTEPVLAVSEQQLMFTAVVDKMNPSEQNIQITNQGGGSLTWTAIESPEADWLSLSQTSGSEGNFMNVVVEIADLAVGTYETKIIVSSAEATNSQVEVPVTLNVKEPSSQPESVLLALEAESNPKLPNSGWEITTYDDQSCVLAIVNSTSGADQDYQLDFEFEVPQDVNTVYAFGEVNVNGSYKTDSFWITLNGSNRMVWNSLKSLGTGWKRSWIFDNGKNTQQPFSVSSGTNILSIYPREEGAYLNWLVVTTDANFDIENYEFGGEAASPVTPPTEPELAVNPSELIFSTVLDAGNPSAQSIKVSNSGTGSLTWKASESPEAAWVNLSQTSGSEGESMSVSVDVAGLAVGTYETKIVVESAEATNSPVEVPITLNIEEASLQPEQPESVLLAMEAESCPTLPNSGWEVTAYDGQTCVLAVVNSTSGAAQEYRLDFEFEVPQDVNTVYAFGEVNVNGSYKTDSFWITLNGSNRMVWNSLKSLGTGWKRSWIFDNGKNTQQPFSVSSGTNILSIYPREEGAYLNWLVVTTDANFDIENYEFGGEAATPVTPPTDPEPKLAVSQSELTFSSVLDADNPSVKSLKVSNSGTGNLTWTAAESPEAAWLNLSQTSGGEDESIAVSVDVAGLAVGTYETKIVVESAEATNSPVEVPVILNIKAPSSQPESILLALEAESNPMLPNSGWEVITNSGQVCVRAIANSTGGTDENHRLDFTFEVPDGVDTVYAFGEVDINGSYNDDSFWVTFNGRNKMVWNGLRYLGDGWNRVWIFNNGKNTQQPFSVSPGLNTLSIYPREDGAHLNWLVITTEDEFDIYNYEFPVTLAKESPELDHQEYDVPVELVKAFKLNNNFPNPFNSSTTITFEIPENSKVQISIFNVLGQKVYTLCDTYYDTGKFGFTWDGIDNFGNKVMSGIYFCLMQTPKYQKTIKLIIME